MILTDEEARKKLCPLAGLNALIATNMGEQYHPTSDVYRCQASDCMWWKVEKETSYSSTGKFVGAIGRCGIRKE